MSNTQGEEPRVSLRAKLIGGGITLAVLAATVTGVAVAAHAAQVKADALHAMSVAAPAYQGAIDLGGNLDDLAAGSAQAKKNYDAEQAHLAAEKAAQEAAAAQAAAEQAAAEEAARQQAATVDAPATDETSDPPAVTPGPPASGGLPSGTPVPSPNGYYDTTLCASGSASTINGVPTCD